MSNLRFRLQLIAFALMLGFVSASAQNIRYVSMNGENSNDGTSWATAKRDVQDAINDLVNNNLTGEVWVAAGTYYPTETTESSSSPYHKSFKIPAGITVRGGFRGKVEADAEKGIEAYAGETSLADRHMEDDAFFGEATDDRKSEDTGKLDGEDAGSGVYSNKTVLCGDLNEDKVADVTWNEQKQQFDVTFYGNSYHVVWFAMNGFDPDGRALPLASPAKLEGCVVKGGHAYTNDASDDHLHVGYGGGIYMVANSFVYNSEVKECDASRNGGGIYMDGGGIVRRTFVHDCQALGIGTEYGLGGGICEDATARNSKSNPIVVAQSAVTNCAARIGGGMALVADKAEGNNKYAIVANSTVVNNNTAQVEAGGVYTYKGGGLASMTIVRNKCNGSGITQNGVITGRSGGVYCRDAAYIGNIVIWGNECAANKDIQYADSRSSLASSEKTKFYYSALSNAEITDWSKTEKMGVLSLDEANTTTVANKGNKGYPLFEKPTESAGYLAAAVSDNTINWKVFSESALHHAGINTADLDYEGLTPAPQGVSYDMQFGVFNSRCTMGALVSEEPSINAKIDGDEAHFFVDPSYNFAAHHDQDAKGASWDLPTRFLGNVLEYVKRNVSTTLNGKQIFVHVKQGTVDNTDSYQSGRVRTTSLDIPSNVTILGSYDKSLTSTNLDKRNVVRTPTVISGKLLNDYKYNIAHLINIKDASNVTLDGFQISYANAASTELGNTNKYGAAITIKGSTTGIKIKNIIVSNSQAEAGAAVYADASAADFENCIFHNNTTTQLANSGVVYATNGSALTFDHCDVLRNVGHASYLGSNNTTNVWNNSIFYGNMDRSLSDTNIDSNNSDPTTPGLNKNALAAFSGNTANASGSRCMFDAKSASFASKFGGGTIADGGDTGNKWQYNLQYAFIDGTGQGYPRFINPTKNAGVTEDGDQTYYGRATSFEPHNNNPIVNLASDASLGEDIIGITRNYGGLPDIGAVENHEADKAVEGENAYTDGQKKFGEGFYVRDYTPSTGTQMDTYDKDGSGNLTKNNEGKGIYTANGDLLDGTSWEYAINGNGIYALTGTRKKAETDKQTVVKGYRIYTGQNYLIVNSGTLRRDGKNTTGTVFALYDAEGNKITDNTKIGNAKRLVDTSTGNTLYLNLSGSSYTFRTTPNPDEAQATATLTASGSNYSIQYTASNGQKRYIRNNNTLPSTTATNWTFAQVTEQVEVPTGVITDEDFNMGSFTGLQYAVNLANIRYHDDFNVSGGDVQKSKKQVWVGAGVYKRDPAKNTGTTPSTPIIEMDEENCFIIQDGVDVYGAFPKTGNPGMDQRQALVSQYVHVQAERNISNIADFETILEPVTKGVTSGVTRRVLGQPYDYNPRKYRDTGITCPVYTGAKWDGFTLREGVLDAKQIENPSRNGGAGAAIYGNVTLKNVVVTNNTTISNGTNTAAEIRAGGIYMDGGTVDAGYVINNTLQGWNNNAKGHYGAAYGGGLYIYTGTVFNSVVANNNIYSTYADGAGLFIENANFFNNTIVNNKAEGSTRGVGGIAVWTDESRGDESVLNVYNTISVNNVGYVADPAGDHCPTGNKDVAIQNGGLINLYNCITENAVNSTMTKSGKTATINYHSSRSETTPSSIFESLGSYDSQFSTLNLRLKSTASYAINAGDDSPTIYGVTYDLTDYNDMDFAERIQDCRIDIGAYEFNGATAIAPQEVGDNQAIYYVTPEGYGTTNANDPENAACASKLQRVLDAAGRYKYLNPNKQVIVKVANSYDMANPKDDDTEPTNFTYYATRTTDWTDQDVRVWSIIVPRGVEVWGGYTDIALNADGSEYKVDSERKWDNTHNGFTFDGTDRRNITKYPTYFDSYYVNKLEKTDAHTYHVVTFSDRIFDVNGYAYTKDDFDGKTADQIRTIIQNGAASSYVELPGNDETLFAHMSEAIDDGVSTGVTGNVINIGTLDAPVYASNRAVIDGIFVSGGQANASSSNTGTANINQYGGAALVNDYAYVRNCILTGNTATNGGALALTDRALVSGCLIMNNEAKNAGGGIYVFEEGTKLSNGTTIQSMQKVGDPTMDYCMAHVITSTIVNNKAQQGGGVWFTSDVNSNARFNSVAVWQNEAADQDNVHGMVNPEQPTEDETISEIFYPFAYSLIENIRASGTNNLEAMALNRQGVRFVNKAHDVGQTIVDQYDMAVEASSGDEFAEFGYYGLTRYSTLCSNGMPKAMYNQLKEAIAIADVDFMNQGRIDDINNFVEIGARALPKRMPSNVLMLRLFVAHPEVVDTKTANQFMRLSAGEEPGDKTSEDHKAWESKMYYSQMGSSFAYPFNFLQDAIDYITRARNGQIAGLKLKDGTAATSDLVRNLPFEIVLGSGTYYPRQSLSGATENVWAHTFAIPEGVTIIGGFNPEGGISASDPTYYGRYYQADKTAAALSTAGDIYTNVTPIPNQSVTPGGNEVGRGNKYGTESVSLPAVGTAATAATGTEGQPDYVPAVPASSDYMPARTVKFQQWHIQDIADRRAMADNNKNGIIEPWEFANQTIISGNAVNGETDGVYHIMTAVADEDAVGRMPKVQKYNKDKDGNIVFTGYNSITKEGDPSLETGYQWKEEGQQIRLNGLIITGGNALTYLSTALDDYGSYIFYQGAGLQVDGNRYKNNKNNNLTGKAVFHNSAAYGVGYRDIPVSVTNCQFRNNIAGYGGAISTNGSLSLFGSSFEQNLAIAATEKPEDGYKWYSWVNDQDHTGSGTEVKKVMYPGQGGAILATGQLSAFNTLFANNEARYEDEYEDATIAPVVHPTFRVPGGGTNSIRAAGGAIMMGSAGQHHIVNCDFVRNKANAYPAVFTMNPTYKQQDIVDTHSYSQIINTVAWGNEVNPDMLAKYSGNAAYKTASKLLVNIGKKERDPQYIKTKGGTGMYEPSFTDGNVPSKTDLDNTNADANGIWQESVWFCAYEDGVGFKPNNEKDLRDAIEYTAGRFAPKMIKDANGGTYQNCNMLIVADNNDVAGPNFGNPSVKAGFDGFMEGADWSPARFNRLTDNGNGWIKQTVTTTANDIEVTFNNDEALGTGYQGAYPYTHYISDIVPGQFPEYKLWIAIGNEKYMEATNDPETRELTINGTPINRSQKNIPRISPDPTMGVEKAYIDIGVYEYVKQPLLKPGSEVDILWVSTKEKPENGPANGATWKTPTSDLQRAIETLLSSRNGHKKEIRIMEGEYAPVTPKTIGGTKYNAFIIDTKSLNEGSIVPSSYATSPNKENYYAQSLTIKGGYSADIMYEYNPVEYKTVIRQGEAADGVNTDHLIYIADPTLRYYYEVGAGKQGYTDKNQDGAIYPLTGDHESNTAKSMPIQIDGVTLINSKANASAVGSAIYYPDYADKVPNPNYDSEEAEDATTNPMQIDGVKEAHSISVGGEIVYYTDKEHTQKSGNGGKDETDYPAIEDNTGEVIPNPAKIVITKTQVIGSGNTTSAEDATKASAVYIGQNGGSALIYNTVFHSNYGMPLNAWNTVNVNNTFGLNAGKVQLQDATGVAVKSQMHNSALWKNNKTAEGYGDQFTGAASFSYNSYTGCATDADNNTSLSDVNSNIAEGPNFVDPENADIEARNFDLKPSMRLLNQGSETATTGTYYTKIMHYYVGKVADVDKYANYDYALIPTTDVDVLNRDRFKNNIDRGAYEFQGSLFEILYVDPNKSHRDDATGENWNDAFGYGDLQNAIDLAAIYHATNPNKEAYVFVKGNSSTNKGENTNETITIRDGVTTYGSILSSNTNWHGIKKEDGTTPKYSSVDDYIRDIRLNREGVASTHANQTIVTGIKTADAAFNGTYVDTTDPENPVTYNVPAIIDGFVVTDPNGPTAPVLDITNTSENATIVVRNVIVADNDMSKADGDVNVAQISNGLIYEALFRDNKPKGNGAVLKVSNNPEGAKTASTKTSGYAVNVTVEGKTVGADGSTPVDGKKSKTDATNVESETQIYKSITNSIDGTKDGAYGKIKNPGIFGYYYNIGRIGDSNMSTNADLNYQLSETSKYIDMCELDVDANGNPNFLPDNLKTFVCYKTDRDILGNPRLLAGVTNGSKIDRGAFETWKVENDWHTGHDNSIAQQSGYETAGEGTYLDDIKYTFYPHAGSAVYLMEGKYIVLDAPGAGYDETTSNPGFLLVKDGANLYTNGRHTTVAYVAVERKVKRNGSIVALPYEIKYGKGVATVGKDGTDLLLTSTTGSAYLYSGGDRSAWDYIFNEGKTPEGSVCWKGVPEASSTKANAGVLYAPNAGITFDTNSEALLRFTAQGAVINDYIYEEYGPTKAVTLTQYDDAQSTNNGADFTNELDMGWNCIGIPYLVSDYKPYEKAETYGASDKYMMNIPHTLWLYYDGVHTPDYNPETDAADSKLVDGDGGYYSVKAWKSDDADWHVAAGTKKALWVGEGFFTQTATLSDTENLTFYRPIAPILGAKSSAPRMNARYFYDANGIEDVNDDMNGSRRGESVIKFVRNGKVYIQKNGKTYTAAGQLVENADM